MQTFRDGLGRSWTIKLTFAMRQKIKSATGCDVLVADSDLETLERFGSDIELIAETFWILCEDEALKRQVSMESFSEGLTDDVFLTCRDILFEEIASFIRCLQPARGERLKAAVEAVQTAGAELMNLQTQHAKSLTDFLNSGSTLSKDTSTSLQDSSA